MMPARSVTLWASWGACRPVQEELRSGFEALSSETSPDPAPGGSVARRPIRRRRAASPTPRREDRCSWCGSQMARTPMIGTCRVGVQIRNGGMIFDSVHDLDPRGHSRLNKFWQGGGGAGGVVGGRRTRAPPRHIRRSWVAWPAEGTPSSCVPGDCPADGRAWREAPQNARPGHPVIAVGTSRLECPVTPAARGCGGRRSAGGGTDENWRRRESVRA